MSKIFDLEQDILSCWHVTDDLKLLYERIGDSSEFRDLSATHTDAIMNILLGLQEVYDMRFEKCFRSFEAVSEENRLYRKISGVEREQELVNLFNREVVNFSRRPTSMADEHED